MSKSRTASSKAKHMSYRPSRSAVRTLVENLYDILLPLQEISEASRVKKTASIGMQLAQAVHKAHQTTATKASMKQYEKTMITTLTSVRRMLRLDIDAALRGDPAALTAENVIASYPGPFAIATYRIAHELHRMNIDILPRQMTEVAHSMTGIDIHPGAMIGEGFFIDHGTGVVIGETTIIGKNVRLYQGVTLGAGTDPMKAGRTKRHPTLEDDVICYANSSILGPVMIGRGARIGASATVFDDVPPDTTVLMPRPELIKRVRSQK